LSGSLQAADPGGSLPHAHDQNSHELGSSPQRATPLRRGKYWLGIRTACEPLFHSTALASYAPMMNEAINQLVDKMQVAAKTGEGGLPEPPLEGVDAPHG
jgi:hypothetical protein